MAIKTSKAGTEYMLELTKNHLQQQIFKLEATKEAKSFTFPFAWRNGHIEVTISETDSVTYPSGYVAMGSKQVTDPTGRVHNFNFDEHKKNQIWQLERDIKSLKDDIDFLKRKIADFKGN